MHTVTIIAALLAGGALVTFAGASLIERRHPPRGRFIEIGGFRQHVVELGPSDRASSAQAVVLLHGAGCNLEDMRLALGQQLAARHRVILVDRPGLGWSERRGRAGSSPAYQARVLRDLLDRLGIERAIVVGHSWGGAMAVTFGLDHPHRAAGLVLIAPPTHPLLRRLTWLYTILATPVAGWIFAHTLALPFGCLFIGPGFRSAFRPQTPPPNYMKEAAPLLLFRPPVFVANAQDVADLRSFLARQVARYPTLTTPTLIITGDADTIVSPQEHAAALAAVAPGAKLRVLPGFGHMLHHAASDRVREAVEELAR